MAKRTRTAMAVAAAWMLGTAQVSAAAEPGAPLDVPANHAHVRSTSPAIATAIQAAMEHSATFRGLIDTINASESYVFVNEGNCGHGVRACFTSVRSSGPNRYLFVKVDPRKTDCELITSIAHELRHTIEVIGEPSVRTDADKHFFYERIGMQSVGGTRETLAAMDAGNTVRSEVIKFNRQAKSE
jgi:hypothetical protein